MKNITITAYNRPELLRQTLQTLSENNLIGYTTLFCGLEPTNKEVEKICKEIKFIKTNITVNREKLGVRRNPFVLLNYAFTFSDFIVYLEDDILLSKDALDFANFFYNNYKNNNKIIAACFHNYNSNSKYENDTELLQEFVAIGFCLFKQNWDKYFKHYWFDDNISRDYKIGGIGWDWSIRAMLLKNNQYILFPKLSRSMHIGINGTHCRPEDHKRLFEGKEYYRGERNTVFNHPSK